MSKVININRLKIELKKDILLDLSFKIKNTTALIGESGSGKSLTLKTILNLLPKNLCVNFDYSSDFELNYDNIGFIPQNPFTSLSPMTKIKNQFFCKKESMLSALKKVGLDSWVLERFPNQLSGGQLQRVVIAIAISKKIKLLLLDEPTTALDEKNKKMIIDLIKQLSTEFNLTLLFITHDIDSIKDLCENMIIIRKGKIIQDGKTNEILQNPNNQYTKTLIESNFKTREFRK
ncbi:ATP-binding cassette domain-containing protein [Malaciobacter marinus]|jgi:peptide/nickel transport system ATP-binding protein|uniref:Peptide/nickel transport system ATP-binding protein n=1 Tax=Malaciobacter marinus TaxID=505249 RepID=A0AB36ZU36_9BACT|nr:ATP-binding cassette domain-containing protein [Malaciobacter marinus]PPK60301.1 peptide/nickel transport system ATP-binding protein [Malaciobacter marinus]SKB24699.1 peptide/nickel transport system ATP-binding protein [Malaciobacter marinus]